MEKRVYQVFVVIKDQLDLLVPQERMGFPELLVLPVNNDYGQFKYHYYL